MVESGFWNRLSQDEQEFYVSVSVLDSFTPGQDKKKTGGAYVSVSGTVKKIDDYERMVILRNGTSIPIDDILHNTAGQSACEVGAGANQREPIADTADVITGWEQERSLFFSDEVKAAAPNMDATVDSHSPDLAGIGGSVVQLGRALERLDNPVPIKDATTKPPQHTGKKRKLAVGQKEDDHSGHDFEMKM